MRLRVQAGYYNWIPFAYECPECKVMCRGEVLINSQVSPVDKKGDVLDNLWNCKRIKDDEFDVDDVGYVIQLSTELYTDKMLKSAGSMHQIIHLSPHMQYAVSGAGEKSEQLQQFVKEFLTNIRPKSELYTSFWDLYEKSPIYLRKRKKELNLLSKKEKKHKKVNESDKISFLQDVVYRDIRESEYYNNIARKVLGQLETIRKKHYREYNELFSFVKKDYGSYVKKIYTVTSNFLNYYNYILPVMLNEIVGTFPIDEIKAKWGIAQTDFETIKKYYSDNYEDLKDLILIIILMNNISNRGKINKFHSEFYTQFPKVVEPVEEDLENFNNKIKNVGNRIKVLLFDESNNEFLKRIFDNEVRNSIDHRDYSYDANEQKISFQNKTDTKELYLIEFGCTLFYGFIYANILWDAIMYIANESDLIEFK
ncbi:TPA: hypothetical protein ACGO0K_002068 [Streptococcus suis]